MSFVKRVTSYAYCDSLFQEMEAKEMDEEYSVDDVRQEIKVVKVKIAENARMQLVASEHSDIMNMIFHRVTLKELLGQAEVLRAYKSALMDLLPDATRPK